jgi:site-specific recombinase XerD
MSVLSGGMDLYNSPERLNSMKRILQGMKDRDRAIAFLECLEARGLNTLTVLKYSIQLPRIMKELGVNADRGHIEEFMRKINNDAGYSVWTKRAYKQTVRRFYQYLKNGDISGQYPDEVAWLKTNVSERQQAKESRVTPDKLLSVDEVRLIIEKCTSPRNRAMLSVLFEGAFRPGELLAMNVGSVSFQKDYCVVSTKGKTGI